jgi:HK97 gp10 family phage protein
VLTLDTRGFADLQKRLDKLAKEDATKAGQAANRAGATVLRKAVIRAAPDGPSPEGEVRTRRTKGGATRKEVHHKIKNWVRVKKTKSMSTTEVQNSVSIYAYTATFVEFGSIHNAPNAFFQRAIDNSGQAIIDAMAKMLNRQLIRRGV